MALNGDVLAAAPRDLAGARLDGTEVLRRRIAGGAATPDRGEFEKAATATVGRGPGAVRMHDSRARERCTPSTGFGVWLGRLHFC